MLEALIPVTLLAVTTLLIPGANNTLLMASGARSGLTASIPHVTGAVIGFTAMLALVGQGFGSVLLSFPAVAVIAKVAGALWIMALAGRFLLLAIRNKSEFKRQDARSPRPFGFTQAFVFRWVNPGAFVIAFTASAVFARHLVHPIFSSALLCIVFALVGAFATILWTCLGVLSDQLYLLRIEAVRAGRLDAQTP